MFLDNIFVINWSDKDEFEDHITNMLPQAVLAIFIEQFTAEDM
jgi:hypothetical protein